MVRTLTLLPDGDPNSEAFERSFDFSKFTKLREVNFTQVVCQMRSRVIPWIPMALSTLNPTTSPHISSLRLNFIGPPTRLRPGFSIEDMGDALRQIADQVARIEQEFEGVVNCTVIRDPRFAFSPTPRILQ